MGKRVSLKMSTNGRVTIPRRYRDYFEIETPETGDDDGIWLDVEIHGVDPGKHPDHSMATDSSPNE